MPSKFLLPRIDQLPPATPRRQIQLHPSTFPETLPRDLRKIRRPRIRRSRSLPQNLPRIRLQGNPPPRRIHPQLLLCPIRQFSNRNARHAINDINEITQVNLLIHPLPKPKSSFAPIRVNSRLKSSSTTPVFHRSPITSHHFHLAEITIRGVDVFKPQTGEVVSSCPEGIACWFVDTDYNEESFFVRHVYFLGQNDPYKSFKTTLKAEIDAEAWESPSTATPPALSRNRPPAESP